MGGAAAVGGLLLVRFVESALVVHVNAIAQCLERFPLGSKGCIAGQTGQVAPPAEARPDRSDPTSTRNLL